MLSVYLNLHHWFKEVAIKGENELYGYNKSFIQSVYVLFKSYSFCFIELLQKLSVVKLMRSIKDGKSSMKEEACNQPGVDCNFL